MSKRLLDWKSPNTYLVQAFSNRPVMLVSCSALTEAVFLTWVCGTGLGLRSKYHPIPFITSIYKFEVCAVKNVHFWQALRVHSKFKQSWTRCLVEFCKGLEFGKVMRKGKKAKLGEWLKKERKDISRSLQRLSAT